MDTPTSWLDGGFTEGGTPGPLTILGLFLAAWLFSHSLWSWFCLPRTLGPESPRRIGWWDLVRLEILLLVSSMVALAVFAMVGDRAVATGVQLGALAASLASGLFLVRMKALEALQARHGTDPGDGAAGRTGRTALLQTIPGLLFLVVIAVLTAAGAETRGRCFVPVPPFQLDCKACGRVHESLAEVTPSCER